MAPDVRAGTAAGSEADGRVVASRLGRVGWTVTGLGCVVLGSIGIVVPGLPTTIFFIAAAASFSRSNPRLEQWVLDLPRIGPAIRDHRAGLGMPLKAKVVAISMIVVMVGLSAALIDGWIVRSIVLGLGAIGVAVVARQPTKRIQPAPVPKPS